MMLICISTWCFPLLPFAFLHFWSFRPTFAAEIWADNRSNRRDSENAVILQWVTMVTSSLFLRTSHPLDRPRRGRSSIGKKRIGKGPLRIRRTKKTKAVPRASLPESFNASVSSKGAGVKGMPRVCHEWRPPRLVESFHVDVDVDRAVFFLFFFSFFSQRHSKSKQQLEACCTVKT